MILTRWCKSAVASLAMLLFAVAAWAQDPNSGGSSPGTTTTTSSSTTTMWYGQWYIWVGVALFVIIVIALTNRGSKQS